MDLNDLLQLAVVTFTIAFGTQLATKVAGAVIDHAYKKAKETAKKVNNKLKKE